MTTNPVPRLFGYSLDIPPFFQCQADCIIFIVEQLKTREETIDNDDELAYQFAMVLTEIEKRIIQFYGNVFETDEDMQTSLLELWQFVMRKKKYLDELQYTD